MSVCFDISLSFLLFVFRKDVIWFQYHSLKFTNTTIWKQPKENIQSDLSSLQTWSCPFSLPLGSVIVRLSSTSICVANNSLYLRETFYEIVFFLYLYVCMYLSYGKVALSKTERSDWVLLGRDFAIWTVSTETVIRRIFFNSIHMYGCAAWTATLAQ